MKESNYHDTQFENTCRTANRHYKLDTISNPKGGGVGIVTLHSGRELSHQCTLQQNSRLANAEPELRADSQVQQSDKSVPLPFPTWTVPERRSETDENLLKLFKRVEINIPLLDAINQVPKYAKFLKELCIYKRKKMKGGVKTGGIVSALIK
ncbi:hypothetical protein CR513_14718, partial [Mucuna pruriens]